MIDEAHSACVLGRTGGGVDEYFGLAGDDIDMKMGTLSKGLGTCGGYLAGSRALIEYLRYNLPGFVFSVGISPPLAAATLEAIRLYRTIPPSWKACTGTSAASARRQNAISTPVLRARRRYCRSSSGATRTPSRSRWRFGARRVRALGGLSRRAARQGAAALLRHLRAQAGADRNGARHPAGGRRGTRHQTA